jgi:hypothetical protein
MPITILSLLYEFSHFITKGDCDLLKLLLASTLFLSATEPAAADSATLSLDTAG